MGVAAGLRFIVSEGNVSIALSPICVGDKYDSLSI